MTTRRFVLLSLASASAALAPFTAIAQSQGALRRAKFNFLSVMNGAGFAGDKPLTPQQVIANLIQVALGFVGVIFVVLTIYGGYLWMTARGNEEQVGRAQRIIRDSIIGVIVVFLAYFVTAFVVVTIGEAVFEPLFPF
jgi:cytochrome bd-type quinol oxidase subunit 2